MTTGKSMDRDDISLRVLSSATTQGLTPGTATTFRLEYREFDRSGPFSAESLGGYGANLLLRRYPTMVEPVGRQFGARVICILCR